MDANRLEHFLSKRTTYIYMISIGSAISASEARELEGLGYGMRRGGDTGLFWLFPASGYDATGNKVRGGVRAPEKGGTKKQAGRRKK